MATQKKPKPEPLTAEQCEAFRAVVAMIVTLDTAQRAAEDWDGATEMLNDLYFGSGINHEEFTRFAQIVNDATDADMRSPK